MNELIKTIKESKGKELRDVVADLNDFLHDVHYESVTYLDCCLKCMLNIDNERILVTCDSFGKIMRVE